MASQTAQERALAKELQKAARNGNVRLVRQLLAKSSAPDAQDVDGWTCLHAAAVEGHALVVRELCGENTGLASAGPGTGSSVPAQPDATALDDGADVGAELVDVNLATACGRTALYFAAMIGSAECVRVLLKHGADPLIRCKDGNAALDVAALFERSEVQGLLEAAIQNPRPPVKRRPKCPPGATRERHAEADAAEAPAPPYVPPEPSQWRKSDFTKWSSVTEKDLEAMDQHQQRLAQDTERERQSKPKPPSAPTPVPGARDLPYGDGRIGPPKSLPPSHPRYQDYKEWLDIQEDLKRERSGGAARADKDKDRLISLKPPSEGGASPDKNNGSHGVGYTWGQTLNELQVWVVVAKGTTARDISCDIAPTSLSVKVRRTSAAASAPPRTNTVFHSAQLWRRVKADESLWTLEEGLLTVTLVKVESGWWRCVTDLEGHPKIDSSLCRAPDRLDEYEGGEQEELRQFFQRQLSRRL
jgi:hypothetical protein